MSRNSPRGAIHPMRLYRRNDRPNRSIDFDISDSSSYYSDSYYSSDSIPTLSSNISTNINHRSNRVHSTPLLFSDDSQDDGGEINPTQINSDNNNSVQENNENEVHNDNLFEIEESSTQNDRSSNNNNDNISIDSQINQSTQMNDNQETPQNQTNEIPQNNIDNHQQNSDTSATSSHLPRPNTDTQQIYKLLWSRSGMLKNNIQMSINDQITFQSKKTKTEFGKCYIICSDSNVDRFSNSYIGSLKISQNQKRFTLLVPRDGNPTDEHYEKMGLSFFTQRELDAYGVRAFRLAMPRNNGQYFPSSREMNLSKIAQRNENLDDFEIFSTKLPELRNNGLFLNFQSSDVMSSTKNFIIEDENENVLFKIYKSRTDQKCSMIINMPFTPLIAFCIAIAIITSNK